MAWPAKQNEWQLWNTARNFHLLSFLQIQQKIQEHKREQRAMNTSWKQDCFKDKVHTTTPQWKKLLVVQTSNIDWTQTLLIELERFWSKLNAFDRTHSNRTNGTLSIECFERFQLNAFDIYWVSSQLAISSTVHTLCLNFCLAENQAGKIAGKT